MKVAIIILLIFSCFQGWTQTGGVVKGNNGNIIKADKVAVPASEKRSSQDRTVTSQGGEGEQSPAGAAPAQSSRAVASSPNNDTSASVKSNRDSSPQQLNGSTETGRNSQAAGTLIAGGNDTTFNIHSFSDGGVTTNLGAVDRSGQAQFGQTNWGNSRSTVGESQWTIPPPITASFNKEFPGSNRASWTRNNVDTTIYSARTKSGLQWVTTRYNAGGRRLDKRTEYPLVQPPRPVTVYLAKQPSGFLVANVYKLQVQGRADLYEIETSSGKKIYINNDGMEVNY